MRRARLKNRPRPGSSLRGDQTREMAVFMFQSVVDNARKLVAIVASLVSVNPCPRRRDLTEVIVAHLDPLDFGMDAEIGQMLNQEVMNLGPDSASLTTKRSTCRSLHLIRRDLESECMAGKTTGHLSVQYCSKSQRSTGWIPVMKATSS